MRGRKFVLDFGSQTIIYSHLLFIILAWFLLGGIREEFL
jgi:hypothetical protein